MPATPADLPTWRTASELMQLHCVNRMEAQWAYDLFVDHCNGIAPPRVPGMDTVIRLAVRISGGCSIEQAAAREYLYRWNLALDRSRAFGAPHPLGLDGV